MTLAPLPLSRIARHLGDRGLRVELRGPADVTVTGVCQDSREAGPGDLFLAWKGAERDAHDYVGEAVARGAVAVLGERSVAGVDVPHLLVQDGRLGGALAADLLMGSPWRSLSITAVTGTNGKTTTALLVRHLLSALGPAAALGTLGLVDPDGSVRPGTEGLTTPGPVQLARQLRTLVDEGVRSLTMEASSHALAQRRLDALRVQAAVFTNLSQDHLDYHLDLDDYFAAKARLLGLLAEDGTAVVNADDPAWTRLPEARRRMTYAIDAEAELQAQDVVLEAAGSRFTLAFGGERVEVRLPLPGRFNVENALAAVGAACAAGLELGEAARALEDAPQVPGRLEVVAGTPFTVVVDFAHTPDALERVLGTLRSVARGRLIAVFGAGGDRDRTKRRPMAEAVARSADLVIATSDNPRTEDPERIVDDLVPGLAGVPHERITDRRSAIHRALEVAAEGDVVLLAGKGHERYQVVGTERRPFDEREVVREALEALGVGPRPTSVGDGS